MSTGCEAYHGAPLTASEALLESEVTSQPHSRLERSYQWERSSHKACRSLNDLFLWKHVGHCTHEPWTS